MMINLLKDIIRCYSEEFFLLFLLVFVCVDRFGSLPIYLCMLIPIVLLRKCNSLTASHPVPLILAFSIIFSIISLINGYFEHSLGSFFFFCVYPLFFYWAGEYVGRKKESYILYILVLIAIVFAIIPIMMVFRDINENQFVNVTRDLYDEHGQRLGNATIIGSKVSLVLSFAGILFARILRKEDFIIKIVLIIFSLLGILVTLHLVNRTGLLVVALCLIFSFVINRKALKQYYFYILILFLAITIYLNRDYLEFMFSESTIAYQERADRGSTIESGGGRTVIWIKAINDITNNPFGVSQYVTKSHGYNYAHNIFLDIPLEGGIISLFLFLVIIIIHFDNLRLIKKGPPNMMITLVFVMNIAMLIQLLSEPVMFGLMQYYFMWFFMQGLCSRLAKRKRLEKYEL